MSELPHSRFLKVTSCTLSALCSPIYFRHLRVFSPATLAELLIIAYRTTVTKEDIQNHFKDGSGTITEIKLMNGFGFIEYDDAMDARDVVPGKFRFG